MTLKLNLFNAVVKELKKYAKAKDPVVKETVNEACGLIKSFGEAYSSAFNEGIICNEYHNLAMKINSVQLNKKSLEFFPDMLNICFSDISSKLFGEAKYQNNK